MILICSNKVLELSGSDTASNFRSLLLHIECHSRMAPQTPSVGFLEDQPTTLHPTTPPATPRGRISDQDAVYAAIPMQIQN